MNNKLTSLMVLGAIALTSPAFAANSGATTPAKGAKACSSASKNKSKTVVQNKKSAVVTTKKAK